MADKDEDHNHSTDWQCLLVSYLGPTWLPLHLYVRFGLYGASLCYYNLSNAHPVLLDSLSLVQRGHPGGSVLAQHRFIQVLDPLPEDQCTNDDYVHHLTHSYGDCDCICGHAWKH